MIDSHCHLDLPVFADDWRSVLKRAKLAGVSRILIPATQASNYPQQQIIVSSHAHQLPIDIALGLHPYFLPANATELSHELKRLEVALESQHPALVALGEMGLDAHIELDMALQQQAFMAQLHLANEYKLPVILHHRKSHHLIFEMLKRTKFQHGGVIHAFSGSIDVAKAYLEKGFYIGVGGTITYERAVKTRNTIAYLLEHHFSRILLETDSPDMPMNQRQGMRNSPEYLGDVVNALCALGNHSYAEIVEQTSCNYYRLFKRVENTENNH